MKFRKKPEVVTAVQWFKPGDHAEVKERNAHILFDREGNYFYISHCDRDLLMARHWLAVDPDSEVARTYGLALDFGFYSVKSGEQSEMANHPELVQRYMASMRWSREPQHFGYLKTQKDGVLIAPGDWIVTDSKGQFQAYKPSEFAEVFESAE